MPGDACRRSVGEASLGVLAPHLELHTGFIFANVSITLPLLLGPILATPTDGWNTLALVAPMMVKLIRCSAIIVNYIGLCTLTSLAPDFV